MKVYIEKSGDGTFSVGIESGDADQGGMGAGQGGMAMGGMGGDNGMQPAASLEEALQKAGRLLQGGQELPNDQWNRVQRDRAMANQQGGPMMGKMA